jgi:hypothetical protein
MKNELMETHVATVWSGTKQGDYVLVIGYLNNFTGGQDCRSRYA